MADQTLMDFFAGQRLTQVAQSAAIKRGVPRDLPAELFTPTNVGIRPSADMVEYIQYSGMRAGAVLVNRMSPAQAANMPGSTRKYATAVNTKEKFSIDITLLDALKSSNPIIQMNAMRELVKRMADAKERFETTKTNVIASTFANGKFWADKSGNVLPSSSGAALTVDFAIPTGNQLTKDGAGSTYNIGDWANAATDIPKFLRVLRNANLRMNNYKLTTILYGENVPSYLMANTAAAAYLARNPAFNEAITTLNEIKDGTFGWKWHPVGSMYSVDSTGATATAWYPGNYLGIMPDVTDDWYEYVPGGNLVPNGIASPGMSLDQMIGMVSVVSGDYSYAEMSTDPLSVNLIQGDSFIGIIKVPGVFYPGTCS